MKTHDRTAHPHPAPVSHRPRRPDSEPHRPTAAVWLWLSVPLAVLGFAGSVIGIVFEEAVYGQETPDWAAQAVGQDLTNLIAFPVLVLLALAALRGSLRAYLAWAGLLAYSFYTYAIYAFAVQFGPGERTAAARTERQMRRAAILRLRRAGGPHQVHDAGVGGLDQLLACQGGLPQRHRGGPRGGTGQARTLRRSGRPGPQIETT